MLRGKMIRIMLILLVLPVVSFGQADNQQVWKTFENNPILSVGEPGSWDAGALGSMTVIRIGATFHMYYEAWGTRSAKEWDREEYNTLQIGHAISKDGIRWEKDQANNPVIPKGHAGEWDSNGSWDPFVIFEDGIFKMWYGGNNPACNWGYAVSKDGSHFEKKGKISDLGEVEDIHVVHNGESGYYLYYWDRRYEPLGLFCARSDDEIHFDFKKAVNISIENDYQAQMYKFTHVIKGPFLWYMFYADFVRPHCPNSKTRLALSTDGLKWKSYNQNLFAGHDAEILIVNDTLTFAYYGPNGYFDKKNCDIRLMISRGDFEDIWR